METIKNNLNQNQIINRKEIFANKIASPNKEKQILINHKSSLEALLYIIKNFHLEYILQSNNKNQKQK